MAVMREPPPKSVDELKHRVETRRTIDIANSELAKIHELRSITDALVLLLEQREAKS